MMNPTVHSYYKYFLSRSPSVDAAVICLLEYSIRQPREADWPQKTEKMARIVETKENP